ncbi:GNAT family N-acetyltransferase [Paenibacillus hodogayensis]|uniref:GNAT family N-acetyltransferase n=1 Tax=Paenibacillus hodogayensis TaxID=279208 RepID=A0ABV5VP68_9BACL
MESIVVNKQDQLELCLRLRREVFVVEQQVPADLEIDELDTLEAPCRHVLLLEAGEPVATARMKAYDEETAKIQRVAVRLERRGQGLGRRVMEELERLAAAEGYAAALLDAQLPARAFYERIGYTAVSEETFYDAGILHVRMAKKLDNHSD